MEKIKESWDHNSVTTVFRISHKNGIPVGCEVDSARISTHDCGFGWHFRLGYEAAWARVTIDFQLPPDNWLASYGTSVSLCIALLKDAERVPNESEKGLPTSVTIPNYGIKFATRRLGEIISHPFILFKVTLDNAVEVDEIMIKRNAPKPAISPSQSPSQSPSLSPVIQAVFQRGLFTGLYFDTKLFAHSSCASSRPMEAIYAHSMILDAVQPGLLRLCPTPSTQDLNGTVDDTDKNPLRECDVSIDEYESDSDYDETEVKDQLDVGEDALVEETTPHNPSPNTRELPPAYHPTHNAVRTIRVHGVALKTLKALVYYCYTSEIHFRRLRSSPGSKDQSLLPDCIYCSPKSMYRLADKIGADELKKLSLTSIRSNLSKHNILDELFSHFTSKYPEVLDMELDLLLENIREPEVVQALPGKMKAVVSGAFPHSDEILTKTYIMMQRVK
ncbi:hypothetical protein BJ138DRAFT_353049 [Hygrophoropsis aurantiaca]|uniref:Uncharacterized protein n=1 Tax=Hygrophoropsis aurantiaca TaxID=72124 RepID=A0ACB8A5G0_9AGAM|nr:hypothetical protein BJ138DRAFT_353049 [Hygrophoropsis aurantiaca]